MKKRILITGASGFIGSFLVEEAIKRKYETFAGIRPTSSKKYLANPALHFFNIDFSNEVKLDNCLMAFCKQYGRFDYIIHTAGITKSMYKSDFSKINFENTKRFVQALQRNDLVPDKFVFVSSLASFGPSMNDCPIKSVSFQQPITEYGKSKLNAENFLNSNPDFPWLIINPTAVYGPRDKDFLVLLKSIRNHLEIYIGKRKQVLSFIHVQDLVQAIFLGMESAAVKQKILVSDLKNCSSETFNQLVKNNLHIKTITVVVPSFIADFAAVLSEGIGHISGKVPILNRERLKEFKAKNWSVECDEIVKLGFVPTYNLEEGLRQTINWYISNGWINASLT